MKTVPSYVTFELSRKRCKDSDYMAKFPSCTNSNVHLVTSVFHGCLHLVEWNGGME